jgi:glycosyltransferase involved in cell wall biosynthesis
MNISIVTASFNQAPFLEEMLGSVRSQGYADVEHIVRDGASSDGSVEILQGKQGAAWEYLKWSSQRDNGQSDALNQGFRLASGDVVGWLNADDRYRPGCLQTIAEAFERNPEIDILYGDYTVMDAEGQHLKVRREIEFSRFILFYYPTLCIPTPTAFFRRRIFDEGNFLDESLHYAMDHEYFARLAARGYRFKHLHTLLADFRVHPASKSCMEPQRQLTEARTAMEMYSPVARRVKSEAMRSLCFAALPAVAGLARYAEKLMRGYYFPESVAERSLLRSSSANVVRGEKPLPGEPL